MLRFFRSIRQKLFLEGKVSKYLGYALGEIVLIVVGILIALQISNWNEGKMDRNEERQILIGLKAEFEEQLNSLRKDLANAEGTNEKIESLMTYIGKENSQYPIEELDRSLFAVIGPYTWDPANDVLEALLSSGRLELLRDIELRNRLSRWQSVVEEVRDNQVMMRTFKVNTLWPLMARKGAPIARGWDINQKTFSDLLPESSAADRYENLKGDHELFDLISIKHTVNRVSLREIGAAIEKAENIISDIERNLQRGSN